MKILNPFEAMEFVDSRLIAYVSEKYRMSSVPVYTRILGKDGSQYAVVFGKWFEAWLEGDIDDGRP